MTKVYLGLGGNLGDSTQIFADALCYFETEKWFVVRRVSSLWRSPAWGFEGPDFLNAVAQIESTTGPQDLLKALLEYELRCGRQRGPTMGSRPIDLDLLTWGEEIISEPGLSLPHPATPRRRFVLEPLNELEPNLTLPGLGRISDHLAEARRADGQVWLQAPFSR